MKEMWETPYTHVEKFVANEYCTGKTGQQLWGDYYSDKRVQKGYWHDGQNWHEVHSGSCTDPNSNSIRIEDDDSYVFMEKSSDQGWIHGTVIGTFDTNNEGSFKGLGVGDLFSWVTFSADNLRIWLHWAYAGASDPNAPLRMS